MSEDLKGPRKIRRISRACDYCHHRSIRCRISEDGDGTRCQNCVDFEQPCTYNRPVKRRGAKVRIRSDSITDRPTGAPTSATESERGSVKNLDKLSQSPAESSTDVRDITHAIRAANQALGPWRAPHIASQAVTMDLVEIYFEVIYPIFPFFHRPTFLRKISRGEYCTDQFFFAATMAVCALASARARDGAVFSSRWNQNALQQPSSEVFYAAARGSIPFDLITARDHNAMRACALLAVTAIQYGQIREMHQHLGRYHALVAMDGLHDEANWPKDIGLVELEERRRLFWSMYCLDVYAAVIWNGVARCREAHSHVLYPTEVDDEEFGDDGFSTHARKAKHATDRSPTRAMVTVHSNSWLCGWNFATDLYRVLEHAADRFRTRRVRLKKKCYLQDIFGNDDDNSQASVREGIMQMYSNLPQCFKETRPITLDMKFDRFGFQAANIAATVQLLRMVLFVAGETSIEERCQIASEVVNAFMTIPAEYLRAISSPLLHHLAGIGSVLGSVFEEPLCESEYLQVRSVLLTMAQLLATLDLNLHSTAGAAERLRSQVARIDDYMDAQRARGVFGKNNPHRVPAPGFVADINQGQTLDLDNTTSRMSGLEGAEMEPQFQLPAELLDGWPYAFDFTQSFAPGSD